MTASRGSASPENELLLLLCGTAAARAEAGERIAQLARTADFSALASLAAGQLLLPLAAHRLEESCPGLAPPELCEPAEREARQGRFRGALHQTMTALLVRRLEEAGIGAVPLKGAFLAETLYGDPGLRFSGDLDLLVDPAQLDAAAAVLMAGGYGRTTDFAWQGGLPLLHHALPPERPELPPLDLHWRIHWYETRFSQGILERSEPDRARGRRLRVEDELAALLIFYARNSLFGLRLAADLAAWWDARGSELGELPLESTVASHPELRRAIAAAAVSAQRLVGFPAERVLGEQARLDRRSGRAISLANWDMRGSRREWETAGAAIDWLLAPAGHLRSFARRYWFQPTEAIARTYGLSPEARLRNAARRQVHGVARALKFTVRYARLRLSTTAGPAAAPPGP